MPLELFLIISLYFFDSCPVLLQTHFFPWVNNWWRANSSAGCLSAYWHYSWSKKSVFHFPCLASQSLINPLLSDCPKNLSTWLFNITVRRWVSLGPRLSISTCEMGMIWIWLTYFFVAIDKLDSWLHEQNYLIKYYKNPISHLNVVFWWEYQFSDIRFVKMSTACAAI